MGGGENRDDGRFDRHMARVEDIEPSAFASVPMASGVPRAAAYPEVLRDSLLPGAAPAPGPTPGSMPVLEQAGLAHEAARPKGAGLPVVRRPGTGTAAGMTPDEFIGKLFSQGVFR